MDDVAKKQGFGEVARAGGDSPGALSIVPVKSRNTLANLIKQGARFETIFINPRQIVGMLGQFYVDGSATLDRCVPLHDVMAEKSVAVIATRMKDIAVVQTRLLPRCGFSQVKFAQERPRPRGTPLWSSELIIVATFGDARLADYQENELAELAMNVRPIEFAELIHPSERRLHAFANSYRPGWTTLSEADTWIEVPTL